MEISSIRVGNSLRPQSVGNVVEVRGIISFWSWVGESLEECRGCGFF